MSEEQAWAERVSQWARDRNIIGGTEPKDQMLKLAEEFGELSHALQKDDMNAIADAIGDCSVVLCIIAEQAGLRFEGCCEDAWHQIKDRRGRIENGVFVKEVADPGDC